MKPAIIKTAQQRGVRVDTSLPSDSPDIANLYKNTSSVEGQHRIYPLYNKVHSGRYYTSRPNIQGFKAAKKCVLPNKEDEIFYFLDFCQMEFTVLCDEVGDENMIEFLKDGKDIFKDFGDNNSISREDAKVAIYGLMYGGGVSFLAELLDIKDEYAKAIKANFANMFGQKGVEFFKRYQYKELNYLIQGKAAEHFYKVLVMTPFNDFSITPYIFIHDEIVFSGASDKSYEVKELQFLIDKMWHGRSDTKLKSKIETSRSYDARD